MLKWIAIVFLVVFVALSAVFSVWVVQLDSVVREKFEGKRWSLPAEVFARPLELYPGLSLTRNDLQKELTALGYKGRSGGAQPGTIKRTSDGFVIYARRFQFEDALRPSQKIRVRLNSGVIASITDVESREPVYLFRLDPVRIGGVYPSHSDSEDRRLIKLSQVPESLIGALITVEDRIFYEHHGISVKSILRAVKENFVAGGMVQGGSTLTQQLVKNFYLTSERSLKRKATEAVMSVLVDYHYSKEEILETYLNEVYLGQEGRRAIHGFGLASMHYFGKNIEALDYHEQALLVGMVKGPTAYNPIRKPVRAKRRRDLVLDLMAQHDVIEEDVAGQQKLEPLGLEKSTASSREYPAYLDLVRQQLKAEYPEEALTTEGLRIFTSLDPIVQARAEDGLISTMTSLKARHGNDIDQVEGAVVVTDTQTGEVLAVVGAKRTQYFGFNRAVSARRHIGSLVKPSIYLSALEHSQHYSLATLVDDSDFSYQDSQGKIWQPRNFDRQEHGMVPLSHSLAKSYNQSTARLGMELGLPSVIDVLQRLGVKSDIPELPSMLLGAVSLTPVEVAQMYQTIASSGFETPLRAIRGVTDNRGELLSKYPISVDQKFNPEVMHLIRYALQLTMRDGTGRGAYRSLPHSLNVAGKTGTSNDQRDSWFAGFSGNYLSVVWLGRDDNKKTPLTGSSGALKVWASIMKNLPLQSIEPSVPKGIEYAWVDTVTGESTARQCNNARYMPFISGTQPADLSECAARFEKTQERKPGRFFKKWLNWKFQN